MNYLLARTKGRGQAFLLVLNREEPFYVFPSFDASREYQDDIKLQDDEWFKVEHFSSQPYSGDFIVAVHNAENFDSTIYGSFADHRNCDIAYLVSAQEDRLFCFQKIVNSKIYRRRNFLSLDGVPRMLNEQNYILINDKPDAIYDKETDCLYFVNLSSITSIFEGIDVLYKEASKEETARFLALPSINLVGGYNTENVKTANRRRIKEAMIKYEAFDDVKKAALPVYIQRYCPDLPFDPATQKFDIDDESKLTMFVNAINQRYYTTEIDKEKMLSNSSTRV